MAFEYSALSATDSKRLLKVLPGNDDGVHVELFEETGDTPYRCLSYTWGEPLPTFPIHVNGCRMQVGQNLHEFLVTASKRFASEPLWIDAICINQNDDQEKSVQVQRMGSIFREAIEVLIWLGCDSEMSHFFDWLRKPESWRLKLKPSIRTPQRMRLAAKRCNEHPYWRRAWIVQEVFLARALRLLAGSSEADPDDFSKYWHLNISAIIELLLTGALLHRLGPLRLEKREPYDDIDDFFIKIKKGTTEHPVDFWDAFDLAYDSDCHDRRDKIYSVLAMPSEQCRFRVDYSEGIVTTFQRAAEYFGAWPSGSRLIKLWKALGLTKEMVLLANTTEQYLRCDVPTRPSILVHGPRTSFEKLLGLHPYFCEHDHKAAFEIPINEYRSSDLILCPLDHKSGGFDQKGPNHGTHFFLRKHEDAYSDSLQILVSEEHAWGSLVSCPLDTELWCNWNGEQTKICGWMDAVSLHEQLRGDPMENWRMQPRMVLKLSQEYVFLLEKTLSDVVPNPKH